MLCVLIAWAFIGELDIVATAEGKLLPRNFLRIVQPAEGGVLKELLVREGDAVRAGQVLMRMDATLSKADTRALMAEHNLRKLQLRRIDAELADRLFTPEPDDPPELYAKVAEQSRAYRQAYADALAQERAALNRTRHEHAGAQEVMRKLKYTIPFYKRQSETFEKLGNEGFASALLAEDKQREYIERDQELKAQEYIVKSQLAAIAQGEHRVAQITSSYKQQLQAERVQALSQAEKLGGEWDKQLHRNTLLELTTTQDAIVKEIATHTPGAVVTPGTVLITLVPTGEPLIAEVQVKNQDAGYIQPHMPAKVKIASFPFQKYGMVDGEVAHFSADASETLGGKPEEINVEGRLAVTANYKAHIYLKEQQLTMGSESLKLLPGMQVIAEIHLGKQTIIEYLLSPLRKVVGEAGRER